MIEEEKIPSTWIIAELGEVCEIIMGQSPLSETYNSEGIGLPFFQGKKEFTDLHPVVEKWCSEPNKIAEANDILLSVRAPVGTTNIANQKCCIGRGLAAIRYPSNNLFVFYFLKLIQQELDKKGTGTTFRAISGEVLRDTQIPFPPIEEQHRIVGKIEELLTDLDKGIENLEKAQRLLKIYRQSIIKFAFEGRLTHKEISKGEKPKGWKLLKLKDLVQDKVGLKRGPFGSAIKKEFFVPDGYKVYEQGNAINDDPYRGKYFIDEKKYQELIGFKVLPKDLIVSCSGVTLGRISEIPEDGKEGIINQALLRIRLKHELISNKFFIIHFRAAFFQKKIFDQSQGTAMPNLVGIKDFKEIEMMIPPPEEQEAIVQEIENKMLLCSKIEDTIEDSLQQSVALRYSILKKAFEGKLVKQNPKDEPAQKLLERIRAEKKKNEPEKKVKANKKNNVSHRTATSNELY